MTDAIRPGVEREPVPDDAAALHRDIEETRERLGETVDEIGQRLDVRARMKGALHDAGERAAGVRQQANDIGRRIGAYGRSHPKTLAQAGAALAVVTALMIVVRRRRR